MYISSLLQNIINFFLLFFEYFFCAFCLISKWNKLKIKYSCLITGYSCMHSTSIRKTFPYWQFFTQIVSKCHEWKTYKYFFFRIRYFDIEKRYFYLIHKIFCDFPPYITSIKYINLYRTSTNKLHVKIVNIRKKYFKEWAIAIYARRICNMIGFSSY